MYTIYKQLIIRIVTSINGPVLVKDMHYADLPPPQKEQFPFFVHIVAQYSETNKELIF